jgi:two-component sensor histidine kinase
VRRVDSIALVHEALATSVAELVDLDELVDRVLPAIGDGATAESRAKVRREGSLGTLPAELATPLVLVLTELVHNALAHAYDPGVAGEVVVSARRSAAALDVVVGRRRPGPARGVRRRRRPGARTADRAHAAGVRTRLGAGAAGPVRRRNGGRLRLPLGAR